jgi:hypothetical protein
VVVHATLFAASDPTTIRAIFVAFGFVIIEKGAYNIVLKRAWTRRHVNLLFYRWELVRGRKAVVVGYCTAATGLFVVCFASVWRFPNPPAVRPKDVNVPRVAEKNPMTPERRRPANVAAPAIPRTVSQRPAAAVSTRDTVVPPDARPKADPLDSLNKKLNEDLKKQADEEAARERERKGPEPSDPAYLEKMADRMLSDDSSYRSEAIDALLKADPNTASREAKKKVARAFKTVAEDDRSYEHGKAVEGLVKWAGTFSVPILLNMLEKRHPLDEKQVIATLAELKDGRAAPALVARLQDSSVGQIAHDGLVAMGSDAEDALLAVAGSDDAEICLTALTLLGDVDTTKSIGLMRRAEESRNRTVRLTAMAAVAKINRRRLAAKSESDNK